MVFVDGGKPENPEKNPWSRDKSQQKTQPTYDAGSGNQTQDTLVGGEHSHHCAFKSVVHTFKISLSINTSKNNAVWSKKNYEFFIGS